MNVHVGKVEKMAFHTCDKYMYPNLMNRLKNITLS